MRVVIAATGLRWGVILTALVLSAAVFSGCIGPESASREYVCPSGEVVDKPVKCGLPGEPTTTTLAQESANDSTEGAARLKDLVTLDYIGSYENGTVFDTSVVGVAQKEGIYDPAKSYAPVSFVVGQGALIPGLQEAVIGMSVGEEKGVTLNPEEGFGRWNRSLVQVVARTHRSPLAQNVSRSLFASEIGEPVPGMEYNIPSTPGYGLDWPVRVDSVDAENVYFMYLPGGAGTIETVFGGADVRAIGDYMVVTLNATSGSFIMTAAGPALVTGVNDENITVDFNSPLADKTVKFWIKVLDLRAYDALDPVYAGVDETANPGYMRFTSNEYNFSIEYPADWQVREGFMGSAAAFFTPTKTEADGFSDYLMVTVEDTSPYLLSLDDYWNISVEQVRRVIPDANITDSAGTTLSGQEAEMIVFTGTQGSYRLKWLVVYTIREDRIYSLTYTAEEDNFKEYLSDMEDAISSFEING